jgi:hypothetical protein
MTHPLATAKAGIISSSSLLASTAAWDQVADFHTDFQSGNPVELIQVVPLNA